MLVKKTNYLYRSLGVSTEDKLSSFPTGTTMYYIDQNDIKGETLGLSLVVDRGVRVGISLRWTFGRLQGSRWNEDPEDLRYDS